MLKIRRLFSLYLVALVFVTGLVGLVYAAVQQDLRQSANDPQIQLAENAAASLASATTINVGTEKIDLAKNLNPFIIVVDKEDKLVASNALLNGQTPVPPAGVLATAKQRGQYRMTWQPAAGVRLALVIVPVQNDQGQFVAVGRSLREVEQRENQLLTLCGIAWLVLLATAFLGIFLAQQDPPDHAAPPATPAS